MFFNNRLCGNFWTSYYLMEKCRGRSILFEFCFLWCMLSLMLNSYRIHVSLHVLRYSSCYKYVRFCQLDGKCLLVPLHSKKWLLPISVEMQYLWYFHKSKLLTKMMRRKMRVTLIMTHQIWITGVALPLCWSASSDSWNMLMLIIQKIIVYKQFIPSYLVLFPSASMVTGKHHFFLCLWISW